MRIVAITVIYIQNIRNKKDPRSTYTIAQLKTSQKSSFIFQPTSEVHANTNIHKYLALSQKQRWLVGLFSYQYIVMRVSYSKRMVMKGKVSHEPYMPGDQNQIKP